MKIVYPKALTESENEKVEEISLKCGILKDTARLLYARGVNEVSSVKRFLAPGKALFLDPFGLSGMREAVNRIKAAKDENQTVLVFGDYDADGICATVILCGCLKKFGISPLNAIPEREEGYGLNTDKINAINAERKIDLIITVDCGISDAEKIASLKKSGMDVIVTDHHEPPEILPDCICINPKIKGQQYGFDGLCGGGVAYKLGYALIGEESDEFLDFAALATVADSMDLVGENRDIVAEGLKLINSAPRSAFRAFLGDTAKNVTAQTLAYAIAPRVNAGGRMGDACAALRLFFAKKEREIFGLAASLNAYNVARQALCEEVFVRAKEIVRQTGANKDGIIIVRGEEWKAGVIGIVAAKLTEAYNKPVIVFAKSGNIYKGSARSVEGVNVYEAVYAVRNRLLTFGGHSQAAGLSVSKEQFEPMKREINEYAEKNFPKTGAEKEIFVDIIAEGEIPLRLAKEIDMLEPFGVGNRKPLFAVETGAVKINPLKEGSPHYGFTTQAVEMLDFNGEKDVEILQNPVPKTLVFELNLSTFRNKESLKGFLRTFVCDYGDYAAFDDAVFRRELKRKGSAERPKKTRGGITCGYGTAYVVTDVKTLKKLPADTLKIYPYNVESESGENCIILSPNRIPDTYNQAVYLDEPFFWDDFGGRAVVAETAAGGAIEGLKTDRNTFEKAFGLISGFVGNTAEEFEKRVIVPLSREKRRQILFCAAVFFELGFFVVKSGIITRDRSVKKPLTDSALYRKVESAQ
ncbi:MAG: single-stranded-DNA-specific exonuclease RecJ [Clostridia bacterium]|nr:single-stranded-DNA-specific exonuclease RecJ [Clostridia bacterium]